MIKSVHDYQIDDVFKKDAGFCYMIPKYQREYTWGQYQWKDLYDDICENDNGYYIGSIICIDNSSEFAKAHRTDLFFVLKFKTTIRLTSMS